MSSSCPALAPLPPAGAPNRIVHLSPLWNSGDLRLGSLLAKRYRIAAMLHRGGMSVVYRAEDTRLGGRQVALKQLRLPPSSGADELREAEAWFAREAYLLSILRHPLIPVFYTVFREDAISYIAQEYVQGDNLDDLTRNVGLAPEHVVVSWGQWLCSLIRYLHGLPDPVVFRDLKPANVLLRATTQRLAVVDFGIARPFAPGEIGTVVGTPGYAPPEQYQGLATPESDVYALGATLHRLLTGYDPERARPFCFPPVRSLNNRVSNDLANLVEHALRLAPAERPSAQAMGAVLDRLSRRPRSRPTIAPPPVPWRNEWSPGISRSAGLRAWLVAWREAHCLRLVPPDKSGRQETTG